MATEVIIPSLGEVVEEVTILKWFKSEGDPVEEGEPLLEVESEKVTVEIESPASGFLGRILFPKGSKVPITKAVAIIVSQGETVPEGYDEQLSETSLKTSEPEAKQMGPLGKESDDIKAAPVARKLAKTHGIDLSLVTPTGPHRTIMKKDVEAYLASSPTDPSVSGSMPSGGEKERIKVSPLARSMAKTHNLDLRNIQGTGPGGRITRTDIHRELAGQKTHMEKTGGIAHEGLPGSVTGKEPMQNVPIEGVRRVIFDNMFQSISQTAQLTLHTETCAESIVAWRQRLNGDGPRVSYNAILVKISAMALRLHPEINSTVDGDMIRVWRQIHIGLAMEANDSLIVPVVRNPDIKTVREIERDITELVHKIRENNLVPDDLVNGTFTISNLGFANIDYFTPIIRPPESAILGVGRISKKPGIRDDRVVPEARMGLSLTFDHRIIDGAPAARFLDTIRGMVEDPLAMIS
ncbi:MAG: 2-oxo acid dehydrogenase subunit E2 [Desulfobacteraceae bacterium]|nr:2-oxo acid dehydrogenase subunit E2 [Desulfobacteraceae bacterium]